MQFASLTASLARLYSYNLANAIWHEIPGRYSCREDVLKWLVITSTVCSDVRFVSDHQLVFCQNLALELTCGVPYNCNKTSLFLFSKRKCIVLRRSGTICVLIIFEGGKCVSTKCAILHQYQALHRN